jgi:hypothetical protein
MPLAGRIETTMQHINKNFLETAGFDTSRRSRLYSTSGFNLNKIAVALQRHGERLKDETIFKQQARFEEALG